MVKVKVTGDSLDKLQNEIAVSCYCRHSDMIAGALFTLGLFHPHQTFELCINLIVVDILDSFNYN